VARHAKFDARHPELRVELILVVKCRVSDNGSVPEPIRRGRGLAIIGELASGLGGRVHTSCAADGCSFLLTFPLTEAEQRNVAFFGSNPPGLNCRQAIILALGSERTRGNLPLLKKLIGKPQPPSEQITNDQDASWDEPGQRALCRLLLFGRRL
jgi:hypothetical protein